MSGILASMDVWRIMGRRGRRRNSTAEGTGRKRSYSASRHSIYSCPRKVARTFLGCACAGMIAFRLRRGKPRIPIGFCDMMDAIIVVARQLSDDVCAIGRRILIWGSSPGSTIPCSKRSRVERRRKLFGALRCWPLAGHSQLCGQSRTPGRKPIRRFKDPAFFVWNYLRKRYRVPQKIFVAKMF